MTTIQPRSVWTSTKEGFSHALRPANVIGAVIHYPGDGNVTYAGRGVAHEKGRLRAYRNYHVGSRGWADIGYNLAVGQSGTAYWAAGKKKAAHCASSANPLANAKYFGILLILGDNERPSDAMIATLNEVLNMVRMWYPKATALLGHRQVYGASTTCPGNVIMGLIDRGVIRYGTTPTVTPAPAPAPAPVKPAQTAAERALTPAVKAKLKLMGLPQTTEGVRQYQVAHDLHPDSIWGGVTDRFHAWVLALQKELNRWKAVSPKLYVDGYRGAKTKKAETQVMVRNPRLVGSTLASLYRHLKLPQPAKRG